MALPLGVSWLCLLLWGCICFVPPKGYNTAHGYKSLQTYDQFNQRESLKDNSEDEIKAVRQNGFVSLQTEPVFYRNGNHISPVVGLRVNTQRSQPDSVYKVGKFSLSRVDKGDKVWNRWGAKDQISDQRHSFRAADSTTDLISANVYGEQVLNPPSAPYYQDNLPTRRLVSNDDLIGGGFPARNGGRSVSKKKPVQPSYKQTQLQQFLPVSSGEQHSFSLHKVAYPNEQLHAPSQEFSYFPNKPKYSRRKSSSVGNQVSYDGFNHQKDFHRKQPAYFPSQQHSQSSDSILPRSQFGFAKHVPKYRQKTAPIVRRKPQKQDRVPPPFTVTQPGSSHGSSRYCSYTKYHNNADRYQLTSPEGHGKKSRLQNQNLIPALQEPNDNTMRTFRPRGSAWKGIASHGVKSPASLLSTDDRFLLKHGGYEDAMRAGLVKPTKQPMDHQLLPDSITKGSMNLASWPSEPKGSKSKCVIWRNTQSPTAKKSQKLSKSSANAYIQSKNRSARATTYLMKTCYTPYQKAQGKNAKHQRKPAVRQHT